MTALIVIVCILAVLILIGQIRAGAHVKYSEQGLFLTIKVGPVKIPLIPAKAPGKKKGSKSQKATETQNDAPEKGKRKMGDTISLVREFLPLVGETAGRFRRKIRIDKLLLHVIFGASDPASAAKGYGAGHAVLGIIWPVMEHNFNVKEHDLRVDVDFDRTKPEIKAEAQLTLTAGQGICLALRIGWKALKIYLGYRQKNKEQEAVQS